MTIEMQRQEVERLKAEIEQHMREKVALAALVSKERDEVERLDRINSDQTHELDWLRKEIEILRHDGLVYANEVSGRYYCASPEDASKLAESMRRLFRGVSQKPASDDEAKRDKP